MKTIEIDDVIVHAYLEDMANGLQPVADACEYGNGMSWYLRILISNHVKRIMKRMCNKAFLSKIYADDASIYLPWRMLQAFTAARKKEKGYKIHYDSKGKISSITYPKEIDARV